MHGFRIKSNLNDSKPFFALSRSPAGTEPSRLFPVKFLQKEIALVFIMSRDKLLLFIISPRITYSTLRKCSSERNSGTEPVKLLFERSLKW